MKYYLILIFKYYGIGIKYIGVKINILTNNVARKSYNQAYFSLAYTFAVELKNPYPLTEENILAYEKQYLQDTIAYNFH